MAAGRFRPTPEDQKKPSLDRVDHNSKCYRTKFATLRHSTPHYSRFRYLSFVFGNLHSFMKIAIRPAVHEPNVKLRPFENQRKPSSRCSARVFFSLCLSEAARASTSRGAHCVCTLHKKKKIYKILFTISYRCLQRINVCKNMYINFTKWKSMLLKQTLTI